MEGCSIASSGLRGGLSLALSSSSESRMTLRLGIIVITPSMATDIPTKIEALNA